MTAHRSLHTNKTERIYLHPSSIAKRGVVLLFLAFFAMYFYGLGHFPLLGPDEPRYAQVAHEMFQRGDWITPTLGGHLWFEKPALLYWMMIASFKVFGVSEWSARLGPALSGLLTILAVWWMARRVERSNQDLEHGGLSFWSTLVAGTTLGLFVFSRAASFDVVITMTTTWALAFFLVGELERDAKLRRLWLAGFYVFVGVSLLAKGLVGVVIPFGVAGAYCLLRRRLPGRKTLLSLVWGLPLAAIVAALWYGPIIAREGWPFIDQFFIQHHFARYVTAKYRHPAPFYYYVPILIALALPWSGFVVEGLVKTGKQVWRSDKSRRENDHFKFQAVLVAWILFPLIFFSFSGAKLPGYILPVVPAAALLAGERLAQLKLRPASGRAAIWITIGFCFLFAVAAIVYATRPEGFSTTCALLLATPLFVAGGFGLLWPKRANVFALMIAAATLLALVVIFNCGAERFAERESSKRLLQLASERGYLQTKIFGLQRDDRSPEFYAAGRVVYDTTNEPVMYDGLGGVVWESRQRQATILAFVPLADVILFQQLSSMRVEVVGDNGKFALVAVSPP